MTNFKNIYLKKVLWQQLINYIAVILIAVINIGNRKTLKSALQSGVCMYYIYPKSTVCYFAHPTHIDVHLLLIQLYYRR